MPQDFGELSRVAGREPRRAIYEAVLIMVLVYSPPVVPAAQAILRIVLLNLNLPSPKC